MQINRASERGERRVRPSLARFHASMSRSIRDIEALPLLYYKSITESLRATRERVIERLSGIPTGPGNRWEWQVLTAIDASVNEALSTWDDTFEDIVYGAAETAWEDGEAMLPVALSEGGVAVAKMDLTLPTTFRHQLQVAHSYHADLVRGTTAQTRRDIMTEIRRGITGELFPHEIMNNIKPLIDVPSRGSRYGSLEVQARRIVDTELKRVFNMSNNASIEHTANRLGTTGAYRIWLHSGQATGRPSHIALDGVRVGVKEKFNVGGYLVDGPHDPSLPGEHVVNCKCTSILWYDRWGVAPPRPRPASDAARGLSPLHQAPPPDDRPQIVESVTRYVLFRRMQEHKPGKHDQKSHGGGGTDEHGRTARSGGRIPNGRKQFVDSDKTTAVIKIGSGADKGTYAVVQKNGKGGFSVLDRGISRDEAMSLAGGGEAKAPTTSAPRGGTEVARAVSPVALEEWERAKSIGDGVSRLAAVGIEVSVGPESGAGSGRGEASLDLINGIGEAAARGSIDGSVAYFVGETKFNGDGGSAAHYLTKAHADSAGLSSGRATISISPREHFMARDDHEFGDLPDVPASRATAAPGSVVIYGIQKRAMGVVIHEFGHAVDASRRPGRFEPSRSPNPGMTARVMASMKEHGKSTTSYGRTNDLEFVAEAYALSQLPRSKRDRLPKGTKSMIEQIQRDLGVRFP